MLYLFGGENGDDAENLRRIEECVSFGEAAVGVVGTETSISHQ